MSEQIMKALMQLFALIVKQDGGMYINERDYVINFLTKELSKESVDEYLALFDKHAGPVVEMADDTGDAPPSVKDSVKIFSICKQINRTLNQTQKVVVLMRLYELVNADRRFTQQRMNIINTVAEVFRIIQEEFKSIEKYVRLEANDKNEDPNILLITDDFNCKDCDEKAGKQGNLIIVLRVPSVDLYFIKHFSPNQLFLNGLPLITSRIYTMANGSSLRYTTGRPIYFSDVASHFMASRAFNRISLVAENLHYSFHGDEVGINNLNLYESEGKLIGIMGSSGTGKTTLLNLLCGIEKPGSGSVRVNGVDIHIKHEEVEGVIGYVPQDDLLIEELSIFNNLYFAAKFCFSKMAESDLVELVDKTLMNLGLHEKRDLRVGSPLEKVISGGQRKRLNIALELIREPSILFLDEPTSGLSSRDSENVMDLLRELTFKGKLVFTVIHQPSSDIFKMFDRMIILDQGGEMVYYGNPIEALPYFKTAAGQIDRKVSECPVCGNINPETIFNIVETEVVDEFGRYTGKRKTSSSEWANLFDNKSSLPEKEEVTDKPPQNLDKPGLLRQLIIYARRDLLTKRSNRQYLLLTLLEAPVLGFILSYIIRYIADPSSDIYIFRENENIPIYIFMSIIVALFLGLITSAEEIFKDRKILKREHFLNLNRHSYLLSKILVLFLIAAIQSFLFVAVANTVLGVKGLSGFYFFALFSTAACATLLGLNISNSFNSAVTIYIIVPLLMIPMMVLSGAMFPFDKLNRTIGSVNKVPVIAELMPTRWTYEALMVTQAKNNRYDALLYPFEQEIRNADYNITFRINEIKSALSTAVIDYKRDTISENYPSRLKLIYNELNKLSERGPGEAFNDLDKVNPSGFNLIVAESISQYLDNILALYSDIATKAEIKRDNFKSANRLEISRLYEDYHNDNLYDIVTKFYERNKILEYKDNLIQNYDPLYLEPSPPNRFSFRCHFFAPHKKIFGLIAETFDFNMVIVWIMTFFLYVALYRNSLAKLVKSLTGR